MNAITAIIGRDAKLAFRAGGEAFTLVLFFIMIAAVVPFAVGPDKTLLAGLAPGIDCSAPTPTTARFSSSATHRCRSRPSLPQN
jgi:hypothetical protein